MLIVILFYIPLVKFLPMRIVHLICICAAIVTICIFPPLPTHPEFPTYPTFPFWCCNFHAQQCSILIHTMHIININMKKKKRTALLLSPKKLG